MRTFHVEELVTTVVPPGARNRDGDVVAECDPRGHLSACPGQSQSFICQDDAADQEIRAMPQSKHHCDVPKTNRPEKPKPDPTKPGRPEGELELLRKRLRAVTRR